MKLPKAASRVFLPIYPIKRTLHRETSSLKNFVTTDISRRTYAQHYFLSQLIRARIKHTTHDETALKSIPEYSFQFPPRYSRSPPARQTFTLFPVYTKIENLSKKRFSLLFFLFFPKKRFFFLLKKITLRILLRTLRYFLPQRGKDPRLAINGKKKKKKRNFPKSSSLQHPTMMLEYLSSV